MAMTPVENKRGYPTLNYVYDSGTLAWVRQSSAGAGGGGTQYAEGDVAVTATGTAAMWKDAGNVMRVPTAAKPLPVALISGGLTPTNAGTATLSNVAAAATNQTLLAANAARLGVIIVNDSTTATLLVKFGATASATSYTAALLPKERLTVPIGGEALYVGIIDGIWDIAEGGAAARITELTA